VIESAAVSDDTRKRPKRLPEAPDPREGVKELTFTDYIAFIKSAYRRQEGQTMAEYAVVLGVIVIAVVVALTALSGGISNALSNVTGII
jgi:Flp pilus assembly pilin Flp